MTLCRVGLRLEQVALEHRHQVFDDSDVLVEQVEFTIPVTTLSITTIEAVRVSSWS
jgi:hypothetical protein